MKRSYIGIIVLSIVLLFNIIFTHQMVQQYYFENYVNTLIFGGLNILLFPIALILYKKTINVKA